MSALIPVILTLLTPFSVPVSGGRATEFRFMRGPMAQLDRDFGNSLLQRRNLHGDNLRRGKC